MGLVLEWVYGTIVSTAEKARDSAKKPLGESCDPQPCWGMRSWRGSLSACGEGTCVHMAIQMAHRSG